MLDDYRRLAQLWNDTTPPEPPAAVWDDLATQLAALPPAKAGRGRWLPRWTAALVAVAATVALALWLGWGRSDAPRVAQDRPMPAPAPAPVEAYPVATADEVVILRVEGEDTQTLVVGELPLHGPMELAGPGEVALTSVQPDARDRMLPDVRIGGAQRPMIWARIAAEVMEP